MIFADPETSLGVTVLVGQCLREGRCLIWQDLVSVCLDDDGEVFENSLCCLHFLTNWSDMSIHFSYFQKAKWLNCPLE